MTEIDYDSKFALYSHQGAAEADALIDEFIATLTIEDVRDITDLTSDEAWHLVERCVTFCVPRGVDINDFGFSDTGSRECFFEVIADKFASEPLTAEAVAEMISVGNISGAREAIIMYRTQQEAVVFALDVAMAMALADPDRDGETYNAAHRLRRCVSGG